MLFDGLRIRVVSVNRGHLRWLAEFLAPWFRSGRPGRVDCEVWLREDPAAWDRMRAAGPHPRRRPAPCFAMDGRVLGLPRWRWARRERLIFDPNYDVFYRLASPPGRVTIVAPTGGSLRSRIPLMRVVREFAMNHARSRGKLIMHAAALRLAGHGILVAGPKNAGKTTFLLHALRQREAQYVANDRVLVWVGNGQVRMRGLPTVVGLRPPSLAMFPGLTRKLVSRGDVDTIRRRELVGSAARPAQPNSDGRFTVSPAQLCRLLGARPSVGGRVAAVLFPRIADGPGPIELRRLSPAVADRLLRAACFAGATPSARAVFALPGRNRALGSAQPVFEHLSARVLCFDCRLGRDAYRDTTWWPRLLDQLRRRRPDEPTAR